jgi:hypothetical protein
MHVTVWRDAAFRRGGRRSAAPQGIALAMALAMLPAGCGRVHHWISTKMTALREALHPPPRLVIFDPAPHDAIAGEPFMLRPLVTNRAGGPLRFRVDGAPAWAGFDADTGALWGTPTAHDAGSSARVLITVSNGVDQASLGPLSIDVLPGGTGFATLTWKAPTLRTDGSALRDLDGYRVYYGMRRGILDRIQDVPDAQATSTIVTGLLPGTWYFAISAYSVGNVESVASTPVSKEIPR